MKRIIFSVLLGIFIFAVPFSAYLALSGVYGILVVDPAPWAVFNLIGLLIYVLPWFFVMAFSIFMTIFLFKKLRSSEK